MHKYVSQEDWAVIVSETPTNDDLCYLIRFTTLKEGAWLQLLNQQPSNSDLYSLLFVPEMAKRACQLLFRQNPSNQILTWMIRDSSFKMEAWWQLLLRKPSIEDLIYLIIETSLKEEAWQQLVKRNPSVDDLICLIENSIHKIPDISLTEAVWQQLLRQKPSKEELIRIIEADGVPYSITESAQKQLFSQYLTNEELINLIEWRSLKHKAWNQLLRQNPTEKELRYLMDNTLMKEEACTEYKRRFGKPLLMDIVRNRMTLTESEEEECDEPLSDLAQVLTQVLEDIESCYLFDGNFNCNIVSSNDFKSSFKPGSLIVLLGNNERHNSLFIDTLAYWLAYKDKKVCAVFCQSPKEFVKTQLAVLSELGINKVRKGKLSDSDWNKLTRGITWLNNAQIFLNETPLGLDALKQSVKHHVRHHRIQTKEKANGPVIIDSSGSLLETTTTVMENSLTALSSILLELKNLAVEVGLPIFIAHHACKDNFTAVKSVISTHADVVISLTSEPVDCERDFVANSIFSMTVDGQITVEPTPLRIDEPI